MTNPDRTDPKDRRLVLLILAACAAALLYAVFHFASISRTPLGQANLKSLAKGHMAAMEFLKHPPQQPAQTFYDAGGKARTLADFRGKLVLVNLWATWCTPCKAEMPTLAALAGQLDPQDIVIAAISMDDESRTQAAKDFIASLKQEKLSFYQDPSSNFVFAANAAGLPVTILYSRDGTEIARLSGAADWSSPEAKAFLKAASR